MTASLNRIKASVTAGRVYDVTNHYVTRQDHPAYGTTRRVVTRTTTTSVYMRYDWQAEAEARWPAFTWPKAAQAEMDGDGTIRLYGMAAGQKPADPFLTLTPVP